MKTLENRKDLQDKKEEIDATMDMTEECQTLSLKKETTDNNSTSVKNENPNTVKNEQLLRSEQHKNSTGSQQVEEKKKNIKEKESKIDFPNNVKQIKDEHMDGSIPASKSTAFHELELIRFRNNFFEALEELRMRRTMDTESERKIQQLVTEKYRLENEIDDTLQNLKRVQEEKQETISETKKQLEGQIRQLSQEKAKLLSCQEEIEKETKGLRDDIRDLQLKKYNLEKRVKEQSHKLDLMQADKEEAHFGQVAQFHSTCTVIRKQLDDLDQQQDRLAKNVKESNFLNHKLKYLNQHNRCEMKLMKNDIDHLMRELLDVKKKEDTQPAELELEIIRYKQQIENLRDQREKQKSTTDKLCSQITESKEHVQHLESLLAECHSLLETRTQHVSGVQEEITQIQLDQKVLKERYAELRKEHNEMCKMLEKEKVSREADMSKSKSDLQELKVQHKSLQKSCNDLEELNSKWKDENSHLNNRIKQLEAQLEKPNADANIQTDNHIGTDAAIQCIKETVVNQDAQTEPCVTQDIETQCSPHSPQCWKLKL